MRELSIGEMAELNCISKKTLRVYHDMGLLVPYRVDAESGYRFYRPEQCSTIDMIQQLKVLGASLTQIKDLMDKQSVDSLSNLLVERSAELEREASRLRLAQYNANKLLNNCRQVQRRPIFNMIILEHLPERRIIAFPILYEAAAQLSDNASTYLENWEINLRMTKRYMLDNGLPLELFHNVGCRIGLQELRKRQLVLNGSFVFIDDERIANQFGADTVPEGEYLTIWCDGYSTDGKQNSETINLRRLLDYAEENDFELAGDYLGEIIAENPAFLYEGREMLYKLELPISQR